MSSRSTFKLSSPVEIPSAGTLIGTCKTPKNVKANIAGIVSARASQCTALKSISDVSNVHAELNQTYHKAHRNDTKDYQLVEHQRSTRFAAT
jgi:hypothetical protein